MNRFGCWIIVLVPSVLERISSAFVLSNIETSPLSIGGKICETNDDTSIIGHTLAFKLGSKIETSQEMFDKVKCILKDNKIDYISLIVAMNQHGSNWDISTHKKPKQETFLGDCGPYRTASQ